MMSLAKVEHLINLDSVLFTGLIIDELFGVHAEEVDEELIFGLFKLLRAYVQNNFVLAFACRPIVIRQLPGGMIGNCPISQICQCLVCQHAAIATMLMMLANVLIQWV